MLKQKRNQKGFTLIEIIAVLVLLGILAAVAVPRFFDLQTEAQEKAVEGAFAAANSSVTQEYAKSLLEGNAASAFADTYTYDLGDFSASVVVTATGQATVSITNGPDWFNSGDYSSKNFQLFD